MTREDRLSFCKRCAKRKSTLQKGLVCSLTDEHAAFDDICTDFNEDAAVAEKVMRYEESKKLEKRKVSAGVRFANYLIDRIVIFIIEVVVFIGISALNGGYLERANRFEIFLIEVVIIVAYYNIFEATTQRTLGKIITGTIVVDMDGNKPTSNQIMGRSFSRVVPFEAFSFFGSEASGWHDRWSQTLVVKKEVEKDFDDSLDSELLNN